MQSVPWLHTPKQELVYLVTKETIVRPVTPAGTGGKQDDSNICGNDARYSSLDNGDQHIKAMGYILVQWNITGKALSFII